MASLRAETAAARVVVLANSDDPDSVALAEYYAAARNVPRENIIALPMSRSETISWSEFVTTLWEPLEAELVRRRWIDAIRMQLTDTLGRTKYAVSGHRIAYLVTCRGVPLRIMHDPQLYAATPGLTNKPQLRTNAGAVDAELSLLARPGYPINAFVPNPLYLDDRPSDLELAQVVKVSRLDGPTLDDARGLVDRAIEAERTGLLGRAYVDIGGNHAIGERWLESVAKQLDELDFDVDVDRSRQTFAATARFDAPVLYFGWYAGGVNGPFALPGFQFPPGAIALHIHSFSAATLRSADNHWCGPLIARKVTATVGNVFEPYLEFTHRPDLLLRALARGESFGDAIYYALPELSWQAVAVGDPLYTPFAVDFAAQWERRTEFSARLGGYLTVRKMNQLFDAGKDAEAFALARREQRERPSVAVGFALAQRLQQDGDLKAAADALGFVSSLENFAADEWGMARAAAELFAACDQPRFAVAVYRNLFKTKSLPASLRRAWLPSAIGAAAATRDTEQVDAWREELAKLNAPPDGAKAESAKQG